MENVWPTPTGAETNGTIESERKTSGRRQRRFGGERFSKRIRQRQDFKLRRRKQIQFASHGREFHFERGGNGLGFFLRLLGGGNGLAQTTRMHAVKRLGNRARKGITAEIVGEHRGPGHGLQRSPMQARREDEGRHYQEFPVARKHGHKLERLFGNTSLD
jgi:hypothetical protein